MLTRPQDRKDLCGSNKVKTNRNQIWIRPRKRKVRTANPAAGTAKYRRLSGGFKCSVSSHLRGHWRDRMSLREGPNTAHLFHRPFEALRKDPKDQMLSMGGPKRVPQSVGTRSGSRFLCWTVQPPSLHRCWSSVSSLFFRRKSPLGASGGSWTVEAAALFTTGIRPASKWDKKTRKNIFFLDLEHDWHADRDSGCLLYEFWTFFNMAATITLKGAWVVFH